MQFLERDLGSNPRALHRSAGKPAGGAVVDPLCLGRGGDVEFRHRRRRDLQRGLLARVEEYARSKALRSSSAEDSLSVIGFWRDSRARRASMTPGPRASAWDLRNSACPTEALALRTYEGPGEGSIMQVASRRALSGCARRTHRVPRRSARSSLGSLEFEEIYCRLFRPLVTRVSRRFGLSNEDARDIVQDAFVIALMKLDIARNPKAWLTGFIDYLSANLRRKTRRRGELVARWFPESTDGLENQPRMGN